MPYVNHRWLGGLLTNFQTINQRIRRLHDLERYETEGQLALLPTRERMAAQADLAKLRANLGGVKNMQRVPDAMFVIDLKTEEIAVKEARRLRIPIIGLVDTNCDPDGIDFVIPGNDDAIRSCALITQAIGQVVAEGHSVFRAEEERARQEAEEKARLEAEARAAPRGRGTGQARGRGSRRRPSRGRREARRRPAGRRPGRCSRTRRLQAAPAPAARPAAQPRAAPPPLAPPPAEPALSPAPPAAQAEAPAGARIAGTARRRPAAPPAEASPAGAAPRPAKAAARPPPAEPEAPAGGARHGAQARAERQRRRGIVRAPSRSPPRTSRPCASARAPA